jgi:hypothetical protein
MVCFLAGEKLQAPFPDGPPHRHVANRWLTVGSRGLWITLSERTGRFLAPSGIGRAKKEREAARDPRAGGLSRVGAGFDTRSGARLEAAILYAAFFVLVAFAGVFAAPLDSTSVAVIR